MNSIRLVACSTSRLDVCSITGTGQPRGIVTDATVGVTGVNGQSMVTAFGAQAP